MNDTYDPKADGLRTDCDGCGRRVTLTLVDSDGVLIGDDCPTCGYYTTRYMPGKAPR